MQVFKLKIFASWCEKHHILDRDLIEAVNEIEAGLFDANLGSGLYKKRVAGHSRGKRDGHRIIIAFRHQAHAVLIHGFAKNIQDNISSTEKNALRKLAKIYLGLDQQQIDVMCMNRKFIEVK